MNTKRMIAVLAVIVMAFAAFAVIPGDDVSADDSKIVELKGDFTSQMTYTDDQKVVVVEDLNIIDGGSIQIRGDFIVNSGVTVTIEGANTSGAPSTLTIMGNATIDGSIVSKVNNGLNIVPGSGVPAGDYSVVINGNVTALGDTTGTEKPVANINASPAPSDSHDVIVNGTVTVGTNAAVTFSAVDFAKDSRLVVLGTAIGTIYLSGYAYFDGDANLTVSLKEATASIDIVAVSGDGSGVSITDLNMFAYAYGGTQYYVGAVPSYIPSTVSADRAVAYDKYLGTFYSSPIQPTSLLSVQPNQMSFDDVKNISIRETVTTPVIYDEAASVNRMYAETKMIISPFDADKSVEGASENASIITNGSSVYFQTMVIDDVAVTIGGMKAYIEGDVTYPKQEPGMVFTIQTGVLEVTGSLSILQKDDTSSPLNVNNIIAAWYYEKDSDNKYNHYYTTVQKAINDGAKDISTLGVWIVDKDITIPAGVNITVSAPFISLYIYRGATLTIADGAEFKVYGISYIFGALVIENIDFGITIPSNTTIADVKVQKGSYLKYSNVHVALADAEAGDELETFQPLGPMLIISEDLTVPAGVSFELGPNLPMMVNAGCTVTVEGKLVLHDITYCLAVVVKMYLSPFGTSYIYYKSVVWDTETSVISGGEVVKRPVIKVKDNGIIQIDNPSSYLTNENVFSYLKVEGAYYSDDPSAAADRKLIISSIGPAFDGILDAYMNTVQIFGDATIDGLKVSGTEKERMTVIISGGSEVTMKNFSFAYGKVVVENTIEGDPADMTVLTGDIGTATGRMIFNEAEIISDTVFEDQFIGDAMNLVVRGATEGIDAGIVSENETVIGGTVYVKGLQYNGLTAVGKDCDDRRLTVASGAQMFVVGDVYVQTMYVSDIDNMYGTELYIEGTVTVNSPGMLDAEIVSVIGTLSVNKIDGRSGTMNVRNILIGGSTNSFDVLVIPSDQGSALVTGDGTFNLNRSIAILFSGATVSADVLKDWMETADSTEFYVDDALWITVFAKEDLAIIADVVDDPNELRATVLASDFVFQKIVGGDNDGKYMVYNFVPALKDGKFIAWQTYDEKTKTYSDVDPEDIGNEHVAVGTPGYEKVYAYVDRDYFAVEILADAGIDNVYLNGKVMFKDKTTNVFREDLVAGTYAITYELANGYSGNAVITAIDGEKIVGGGLTFTVNDDNFDAPKKVITLSGIEKSGIDTDPDTHPAQSGGLTTTEILLIVAVIITGLIAVILVLRLNRS